MCGSAPARASSGTRREMRDDSRTGPAVAAQTLTPDVRVKGRTVAATRDRREPLLDRPGTFTRRRAVPRRCERSVDTFRPACLHPAMPLPEPLTRRRAVDLVRVAAALCRTTG
jgi:hypothetical protein